MKKSIPVKRLTRLEQRKVPRDWDARWRILVDYVGGEGVVGHWLATTESPIWRYIGSKLVFDDATDSLDYPWAYNSGMGYI